MDSVPVSATSHSKTDGVAEAEPLRPVVAPLAAVTGTADVPLEKAIGSSAPGMDLISILSGVEETAYTWDMRSDRMDWESNAGAVLGVRSTREVSTGAGFQFLIAAEHVSRRHAAIGGDPASQADAGVPAASSGSGFPYRVQYRFLPGGRRSTSWVWIEDHGRWWPDSSGKPSHARGVVRVINDRYQEEQRLLYRSDHDELTGQLNRIRLTEALAAVIARSERIRQPCAFLMASVDNLSVINETFGFDVGDDVIAGAGRVIRDRLRGGDTIGRYSSNKFGIILNECGPGAMRVAAERFIKGVREATFKTAACPISATISIGGVMLPDRAHTVPLAVSRALQALDRARMQRQDTFVAYEPNSSTETTRLRNIAIADDVTSALNDNRMRLVLQPIVSAQSKQPAFYECLLRMVRKDGRLIGAAEFITIAEQLGLSRLIDRRTLELAVAILKQYPEVTLSLNVSGLTCGDHDWLVALHKLTGGQASITKRLIVEITETAALDSFQQTVVFVDTLKELGCRVAIDDFGAGYTSYRSLKNLNADMVKIDGGFVKNLASDQSDRVFIKMMSELANAFEMETVAEWVTDQATSDIVCGMGITYLQGFHYGMPMEVHEVAEKYLLRKAAS